MQKRPFFHHFWLFFVKKRTFLKTKKRTGCAPKGNILSFTEKQRKNPSLLIFYLQILHQYQKWSHQKQPRP